MKLVRQILFNFALEYATRKVQKDQANWCFLCSLCQDYIARKNYACYLVHVKYVSVILYERITWRVHVKITEAKGHRTFIRGYSQFKNENLSADIKVTVHKALIRTVMTCACPAWEFEAGAHLLRLQHLEN
jgi:hypothetical protein